MLENIEKKENTVTPEDPLWMLYTASAFGALCLGLGDLINNGASSTVVKIAEVLRIHLNTGIEHAMPSLILLVILGVGVCFIRQPTTRADAFAMGFSVFALLTVVTPVQEPMGDPIENTYSDTSTQSSLILPIFSTLTGSSVVYAESDDDSNPSIKTTSNTESKIETAIETEAKIETALETESIAEQPLNTVTTEIGKAALEAEKKPTEIPQNTVSATTRPEEIKIQLDYDKEKSQSEDVLVTIRNKATQKIVRRVRVDKQNQIQVPANSSYTYILEVEAPGLRRSRAEFNPNDAQYKAYRLPVQNSMIPKNIQQLYAPREEALQPLKTSGEQPTTTVVPSTETTPEKNQ